MPLCTLWSTVCSATDPGPSRSRSASSHVGCVYLELLSFFLGSGEADLVQHALHDGVQAAGADVFRAFIHAEGEAGDLFERVGRELQLHSFGFEQRDVLPDQR